jgi:hypothetical protein
MDRRQGCLHALAPNRNSIDEIFCSFENISRWIYADQSSKIRTCDARKGVETRSVLGAAARATMAVRETFGG